MIKAIETKYKGYRFRSRLEARWAVFFDALGVKWEYEKEGFDLGAAGWYLPDFWLPDQKIWIEIKGLMPDDNSEEWQKAYTLSDRHQPVLLIAGPPGDETMQIFAVDIKDSSAGKSERPSWWFACSVCRRIWTDVRSSVIDLCNGDWDAIPFRCECEKPNDNQRIQRAYEAARSARFEHGEMPTWTKH